MAFPFFDTKILEFLLEKVQQQSHPDQNQRKTAKNGKVPSKSEKGPQHDSSAANHLQKKGQRHKSRLLDTTHACSVT
jgi:hypothetical protein